MREPEPLASLATQEAQLRKKQKLLHQLRKEFDKTVPSQSAPTVRHIVKAAKSQTRLTDRFQSSAPPLNVPSDLQVSSVDRLYKEGGEPEVQEGFTGQRPLEVLPKRPRSASRIRGRAPQTHLGQNPNSPTEDQKRYSQGAAAPSQSHAGLSAPSRNEVSGQNPSWLTSETGNLSPDAKPRAAKPTRPPRSHRRASGGQTRGYPSRASQNRVKKTCPLRLVARLLGLLVLLVLLAVMIGGIGSFGFRVIHRTSVAESVSTQVEVMGVLGARPVLQLQGEVPYTLEKTTVVIKGEGVQIQPESDIFLQVSVFDGSSGEFMCAHSAPMQYYGKANAQGLGDTLYQAVLNHTEGSRLLVRRPVQDTDSDAVHMEINVIDILPTIVSGSDEVASDSPVGLENLDGHPTYSAQLKRNDPQSIYSQVLFAGKGEQIKSSETLIAQVGIWDLETAAETRVTWGNSGPRLIDLNTTFQVIPSELADLRVGSRVLFVIPAQDAKGDSALVVVFDILGIANQNTLSKLTD